MSDSAHGFRAVIFDLDGVITQTALIHSRAWKEMFDDYLQQRAVSHQEVFRPFTHAHDYLTFVDGKPRYEGVKSFLESRGIRLEYGKPDDDTQQESYCGLGNRKDKVFKEILERDGAAVYPSTVELMYRLRTEGIRIGVASSSKNCETVLNAAGISHLVETRVDGVTAAELGLKGKPEPDIFIKAADNLGVTYAETVVVEDAISGVQAGKKGNFGLVLGIAREENAQELLANGADIVVTDLSEIGFDAISKWFKQDLQEDNWSLIYYGFDPLHERSREALLSVGNGYFGTRGAMEEMGITTENYPGTYLAGGYNRLVSKVSGRDVENEDFVNVSNWLPIRFAIEDGPFIDIRDVKILSLKRKLDLKRGLLLKEMIVEDQKGNRMAVRSSRFASMKMPQLAGISYTLNPLNFSGKIQIQSALTADHINAGVSRYAALNQQHLKPLHAWAENNFKELTVSTSQSGLIITQTARLETRLNGQIIQPIFDTSCKAAIASSTFSIHLGQGDALSLEKLVLIQASHLPSFFNGTAIGYLQHLPSFDEIHEESALAWKEIWEEIDIQVNADRFTQKLIRLHLYHTLSTCSPHNTEIDFGIPARGLTGEAYRGHIFWDELYILPLYFLHYPEIARSVLLYRYRRLDEARKYAREYGYQGAMFPWQSGSNGWEETQKFHFNPISGKWDDDFSALQRHVNLAIAYNIIQYHHITGDSSFLLDYGAEMLIEICRMWSSKAIWDEDRQRYSISRVMGPDEFHEHGPGSPEGGLKDNAYTNVMTAWMMKQVLAYLNEITADERKFLIEKLKVTSTEIERWNHIATHLNLVIDKEGILSQFDGYFDLQEVDWDLYKARYGNVYRMDRILKAAGKSPDQYKVAKQADTLMLFYNLPQEVVTGVIQGMGYTLPEDYVERNMIYYLNRTSHGSTLSRLVHAQIAYQIGNKRMGWEMFQDALGSDYLDIQGGTTAEGIHAGVMAGTVWMVLNTFGGVDINGKVLSLKPELPVHWKGLKFSLRFRMVHFRIEVTQDFCSVWSDQDTLIQILGELRQLRAEVETRVKMMAVSK